MKNHLKNKNPPNVKVKSTNLLKDKLLILLRNFKNLRNLFSRSHRIIQKLMNHLLYRSKLFKKNKKLYRLKKKNKLKITNNLLKKIKRLLMKKNKFKKILYQKLKLKRQNKYKNKIKMN